MNGLITERIFEVFTLISILTRLAAATYYELQHKSIADSDNKLSETMLNAQHTNIGSQKICSESLKRSRSGREGYNQEELESPSKLPK